MNCRFFDSHTARAVLLRNCHTSHNETILQQRRHNGQGHQGAPFLSHSLVVLCILTSVHTRIILSVLNGFPVPKDRHLFWSHIVLYCMCVCEWESLKSLDARGWLIAKALFTTN